MTSNAGYGHIGGSLSVADIMAILFGKIMNFRASQPQWERRDRLILSAGHICPSLYSAYAHSGFIPLSELKTYAQPISRLQGHPDKSMLPILETSSGSLGQGLSIATGLALALKLKSISSKVYCIQSDAEQEEGSVWEAAMIANHYKLNNLISIIDRNRLQVDGTTENVAGLAPLRPKYEAFGWHVIEADGHNYNDLIDAFANVNDRKPNIIIAHTILGKGIKQIENNRQWHSKVLPKQMVEKYINQI